VLDTVTVCVSSCLSYTARKLQFFRSAICCHLWPVRLYHVFSTLSHKRHDLRRKVTENKMCVVISSTTFLWNVSHSHWDIIINVHSFHVKYQLFLSYFNQICTFRTDFKKILRYQISWKSVQWEPSCSVRTDRHDEANNRFTPILLTRLKMLQSFCKGCLKIG